MIRLTILGRPVSTTNSRRIVTRGRFGKPMSIKSESYAAWMASAVAQLTIARAAMRQLHPITAQLRLDLTVFRAWNRGDLDNFAKGVADALQESRWIENDRQLSELHMFKELDRANPRIELGLETLP